MLYYSVPWDLTLVSKLMDPRQAFVKPEDVIDHVMLRRMVDIIHNSLGPLGGSPSVLGSLDQKHGTNTKLRVV